MDKKKSDQFYEAQKVIPVYVGSAVTAAVIPIPVADAVAITGVQLTMGTHLTHIIYKSNIGFSTLKFLIGSYAASNIGIWAWSLVKTIPGIGTVSGAVGQMAIAGTITAALGYAIVELLEKKEPITKDSLKNAINRNKEKAKKVAEEVVEEKKNSVELMQEILFTQDKDLIGDEIEFNFNLEKLSQPKLTIKNIKTGSESFYTLSKRQKNISIDTSDFEEGQYEAKLTANEIPDIYRYFVKTSGQD